ncbi:dienelactone hydrolase family protein [Peribacillus deserti]|uniref:Alpha/beta hydrolase n=1 Tax=Peribacillus deserti TaxID=673318 RepID=A0A2N5M2Q6_9BACI|nr:dienelactone hydrolase family protein [Peribacillus deserti]PLT28654.1 alpha/beta hydrolase [Peribacillus deserti]
MINITADSVKGYKDEMVPYSLLSKKDKADTLVVMFPGGGYTVNFPLLYYPTLAFLERSFDVLQVNYRTDFYSTLSDEEFDRALIHDVRKVLEHFLQKKNTYKDFYFIGNSLGTIAMSAVLSNEPFIHAKAVWLTPLLTQDYVFNAMLKSISPGLCFIGDNDPFFNQERFNQLRENERIDLKFFEGATHRLEVDNTIETIEILKQVIQEIEQF